MRQTTRSSDEHGAWVPGPRCERPPLADGPLSGLRFGVKDLIDVEGAVTSCGNPDWAALHGPARSDAPVVHTLREAGATVAGKTVTDEFAFSLEGDNVHHGTPRNPRASDRLPGGSSSGSAVAVAAGLVDFALGSDTGGSVRVPASFCGVYGFRPTHGALSLDGVMPFAPSYDTVGWFARDADLMLRIGRALLPTEREPKMNMRRMIFAHDAFAAADLPGAARLAALARAWGASSEVDVFEGDAGRFLASYATLQGDEIRRTLGPWMSAHRPQLGQSTASRFAGLDAITADDVASSSAWRLRQTERLCGLLEGGGVLVLPTTPGTALPKTLDAEARDAFYAIALALSAVAGHAGLPQLTLPLETVDGTPDGLPIGLSIIGSPNSDLALLAHGALLARGSLSSG